MYMLEQPNKDLSLSLSCWHKCFFFFSFSVVWLGRSQGSREKPLPPTNPWADTLNQTLAAHLMTVYYLKTAKLSQEMFIWCLKWNSCPYSLQDTLISDWPKSYELPFQGIFFTVAMATVAQYMYHWSNDCEFLHASCTHLQLVNHLKRTTPVLTISGS